MNTPLHDMILAVADSAFHAAIESDEPLCPDCTAKSVVDELPEEVVRAALAETVADYLVILHFGQVEEGADTDA